MIWRLWEQCWECPSWGIYLWEVIYFGWSSFWFYSGRTWVIDCEALHGFKTCCATCYVGFICWIWCLLVGTQSIRILLRLQLLIWVCCRSYCYQIDHGSCFVIHWKCLVCPLDGSSWMFGDNLSVVISRPVPSSTLMKQHNAHAYHWVCKAIAAESLFTLMVTRILMIFWLNTCWVPSVSFYVSLSSFGMGVLMLTMSRVLGGMSRSWLILGVSGAP